MKNAIVFGCGSKNGIPIVQSLLENGFSVKNIGSSESHLKNVTNVQIEWKTIDIAFVHKIIKAEQNNIDFVFFNQNSSTLSSNDFNHNDTLAIWQQIKNWSNSHWLSCQLPFLVLHTLKKRLTSRAKVGWMLSSYIDYQKENVDHYPDYSSFKFMNYLIMKNFGKQCNYKTFGIIPDFKKNTEKDKLKNLITKILNDEFISTKVYKL